MNNVQIRRRIALHVIHAIPHVDLQAAMHEAVLYLYYNTAIWGRTLKQRGHITAPNLVSAQGAPQAQRESLIRYSHYIPTALSVIHLKGLGSSLLQLLYSYSRRTSRL
jgi:hypothetical protein